MQKTDGLLCEENGRIVMFLDVTLLLFCLWLLKLLMR